MKALVEHSWPGNVRELEHVVERALLMAPGNVILAEDLGLRARVGNAAPNDARRAARSIRSKSTPFSGRWRAPAAA